MCVLQPFFHLFRRFRLFRKSELILTFPFSQHLIAILSSIPHFLFLFFLLAEQPKASESESNEKEQWNWCCELMLLLLLMFCGAADDWNAARSLSIIPSWLITNFLLISVVSSKRKKLRGNGSMSDDALLSYMCGVEGRRGRGRWGVGGFILVLSFSFSFGFMLVSMFQCRYWFWFSFGHSSISCISAVATFCCYCCCCCYCCYFLFCLGDFQGSFCLGLGFSHSLSLSLSLFLHAITNCLFIPLCLSMLSLFSLNQWFDLCFSLSLLSFLWLCLGFVDFFLTVDGLVSIGRGIG